MSLSANKNLAAFQQLAKKAVRNSQSGSTTYLGDRRRLFGRSPSSTRSRSTLSITSSKHHQLGSRNSGSVTNNQSFGDGSSLDDVSSGEGSDNEHRGEKKKGLMYQKTENVITRMRDLIAQWDVFTARSESPPFVECLKVSVYAIPILLIMCLWDTFAIVVFEVPHHCWIDYPGFLLRIIMKGWHFVMMILAMYGFMLSYLSSGTSPRTKLAGISLGIHYLLLLYRIFMEIYFNGFRAQGKLYIERTYKRW